MALVPVQDGREGRQFTSAEWKAFDVAAKRQLSKEDLEEFEKMKNTRSKSQLIKIWASNGKNIRGAWSAWTARSREVTYEEKEDVQEMYQNAMDELLGAEPAEQLRAALKKIGSYKKNKLLPDNEALWLWEVPKGMLKSFVSQLFV
jgi:hypothetical protein